ncbi:nucleotidyltransferase domain-containing protein [Nanoarchaeota archaeon]
MSLLGLLKKPEARKIFGRREIKIIEKQLNGVNLTQSEKNRLSRDVRKKFEFISKIARYEDDFKLKKGMIIKREINKVLEIIMKDKEQKNINIVKLFGSAVENKLRLQSDIDISVEFKDIDVRKATEFRKRVLGRNSEKVDIQVYNVLPEKVQKEIDVKGKVLYEK